MNETRYKTSGLMIRLSNALIWFRNQELQRHDLTSSQFEVIRYLLTHREQEITAGLLMSRLELSQSTIAGILKRLHAKGLIERRADRHDARREFIVLTEKGLALEDSLQGIACKTEEILLRGMSEAQQAEFYDLLQLALENMNAERTGEANSIHG
nr:MarR family transcriptional regulator [uncultured Gemmiger sp.]